jgi:hypothetical protein
MDQYGILECVSTLTVSLPRTIAEMPWRQVCQDSPMEGTGFELSVSRKRRTMLFEIGAVRF